MPPGSPRAGQVFWAHTDILGRRDAHPDVYRPVAIVAVSADVGRVFVVTRTSKPQTPGVRHARVLSVGLDRDGVFDPSWYQSIELSMFKPPFVEYVFDLAAEEPETWAEVLRAMEAS